MNDSSKIPPQSINEVQVLAPGDPLWNKLQSRKFNAASPPKKSIPRYWIGDVPVSTVGNLTTYAAAVKSGKTSVCGAMIGSAISGGGKSCLNFRSSNEGNGVLIHFDTEQSAEDHDLMIRVALRRAGVAIEPEWLWSFYIVGHGPKEQQALLDLAL